MNSLTLFAIRYGFLAFLGAWLLISVVNQFAFVRALLQKRRYKGFKWDVFVLIPYWAFWASPPSSDSVLLYRDRLADGQLTPWKTAWAMSNNPFRSIWSPQIRRWKALDAWLPLLIAVAEGKKQPGECFLSRIYVSTAIYIAGLQAADSSESRQFMVARISGFDSEKPAEILFVSPLVRLGTTV